MLKSILKRDDQAFTASIPLEDLSSGRYIHRLNLAFKADMATAAAVTPTTLLGLINPFEVRLFGSPVISILAADLLALNQLVLDHNPFSITATAATNSQSKWFGIRIPLWQRPRAKGNLNYLVNRVAVATTDAETISVQEVSSDKLIHDRYLHYVQIPWTSASAVGYSDERPLPSLGDLIGILIWNTTIPTATTQTATLQHVRLQVDGQNIYETEWKTMFANGTGYHASWSAPATAAIIDNYAFIDLTEDPIKMMGEGSSTVTMQLDTGVVDEAVRIYPIYLCTG